MKSSLRFITNRRVVNWHNLTKKTEILLWHRTRDDLGLKKIYNRKMLSGLDMCAKFLAEISTKSPSNQGQLQMVLTGFFFFNTLRLFESLRFESEQWKLEESVFIVNKKI
jgi:hypothetical protein